MHFFIIKEAKLPINFTYYITTLLIIIHQLITVCTRNSNEQQSLCATVLFQSTQLQMSTRPSVWGRLANCSDAVVSASCTVDDT